MKLNVMFDYISVFIPDFMFICTELNSMSMYSSSLMIIPFPILVDHTKGYSFRMTGEARYSKVA